LYENILNFDYYFLQCCYEKQDAEDISSEATKREEQLNTTDFNITLGASFDIKIRDVNYIELHTYQDDKGLDKLRPTPPHFTAGDVALREFLGIFSCKIHPHLCNQMTNVHSVLFHLELFS
jgi:hypothetical protein